MGKLDAIYQAMRDTDLTRAIGGGDPETVGRANFDCVKENIALTSSDRVLDFGCGVGRTSAFFADHLTDGALVGVDIIADVIAFCQRNIAGQFSNSTFFCTDSKNPQYDRASTEKGEAATARIGEQQFLEKFQSYFDLVVAFSVFTHFDPKMAERYLAQTRRLLKPGGRALLTWFFDHPNNEPERRLFSDDVFKDHNANSPLLFALFSPVFVQRLGREAGLTVERISFGWWRDGKPSRLKAQHYQDIAIFRA
jgi:SAM-dependent methyltransferase